MVLVTKNRRILKDSHISLSNFISRRQNLQPTYNSGTLIQFYGMFDSYISIANICSQFGRVLTEKFDGVKLCNYTGGDRFVNSELKKYSGRQDNAPIGIFYGFPNDTYPAMSRHKYKIGCYVCETTRIAPNWVAICNTLDYIIVPSEFCKQSFKQSGVTTPIDVIPHGIEPEYRSYSDKRRQKPFTFYNTFSVHSFPYRKSCEELIRVFLKTFKGFEGDAELILRTQNQGPIIAYQKVHNFGKLIKIEPMINLTTEGFARIYSRVHCTVHPSKGEGFGLIPLQSLCCGTPVIAPPVTGMRDYLTKDNAVLLKTKGLISAESWGSQPGQYYSIDENDLSRCLMYMYENWEKEFERSQKQCEEIRNKYTWGKSLSGFLSKLEMIKDSLGILFTKKEDKKFFEGKLLLV